MAHDAFVLRAAGAVRWPVHVVLGLIALLSVAEAFAAECTTNRGRYTRTCGSITVATEWGYEVGGVYNWDALCSTATGPVQANIVALGVACFGAPASGNGSWTGTAGTALVSGQCRVGITRQGTSNVTFPMSGQYEVGVPCPEPEECSGLASEGVGDTFTTSTFPGASGYCNPVSNCKMSVSSSVDAGGQSLFLVKHTDEDCDSGAPEPEDLNDGETCVTTSAGNEFCLAKAGTNCGYFNDSFVCLPRVDGDECSVFGDGGRICGSAAPSPPVPDNGTPGQPAAPADQIESTQGATTNTYNYFNATQVAASSRDPGSSGDNPYGDDDDDGDCEGEECGEDEGSVTGGLTCDSEPVCEGDALQCAIIAQEWRTRCVEAIDTADVESMFADNGDIDGDGVSEGANESLPGSESEPTDVSEMFDGAGWLSARSCPATYSVDLGAFGNIGYSLADACWFFQAIGSLVLVLGAYFSARIVVGAF